MHANEIAAALGSNGPWARVVPELEAEVRVRVDRQTAKPVQVIVEKVKR